MASCASLLLTATTAARPASFIIRGEKAFGMMAPEHGVHRLVRVSPFDSNNRR
ncbi:hypothetical protein CTI14_11685, partial [Methylobacterium radiotolerans]